MVTQRQMAAAAALVTAVVALSFAVYSAYVEFKPSS